MEQAYSLFQFKGLKNPVAISASGNLLGFSLLGFAPLPSWFGISNIFQTAHYTKSFFLHIYFTLKYIQKIQEVIQIPKKHTLIILSSGRKLLIGEDSPTNKVINCLSLIVKNVTGGILWVQIHNFYFMHENFWKHLINPATDTVGDRDGDIIKEQGFNTVSLQEVCASLEEVYIRLHSVLVNGSCNQFDKLKPELF